MSGLCGDVFPRPPLMQWAPSACTRRVGHKGPHRFSVWLYEGDNAGRQRRLTCTWTDESREVVEAL